MLAPTNGSGLDTADLQADTGKRLSDSRPHLCRCRAAKTKTPIEVKVGQTVQNFGGGPCRLVVDVSQQVGKPGTERLKGRL